MTSAQWEAFCTFKNEYLALCTKWASFSPVLSPLQIEAAAKDTPPYPLENSVVFNHSYNDITKDTDLRLLVVADNPGKEEQLECNKRYLVGQSGRIAEGFFKRNSELNIDFRRNAIILNKTPIHTAKTTHLKKLMNSNVQGVKELIQESQMQCARLTAALHCALCKYAEDKDCMPELWLVGYAELKDKGIFSLYRDTVLKTYIEQGGNLATNYAWNNVYVYQHFSMNRFIIDLKDFRSKGENATLSLSSALKEVGTLHRKDIFAH